MTMAKMRLWLAAAVALMAALPAWAQRQDRPFLQHPNQERQWQPRQQQQEPPRPELREYRDREGGRMTLEERQQLRRDIGNAGRELYRRPPMHRR